MTEQAGRELSMKKTLHDYVELFNHGDAAAIAGLYADNATVEDPVGTPVVSGKAAIAAFYESAVQTGAKLKLAVPVRGSHGSEAAMAIDVLVDAPAQRTSIRGIVTMRFDGEGRVASMRAFWGPSDMTTTSKG